MNEAASQNSRSLDQPRGDVWPEGPRPVADQAVEVRRVDPRGWRNETMRSGIVLDCHRQADGIVTVVSVRRQRRGAKRKKRDQRRKSDLCGVSTKPVEHRRSSVVTTSAGVKDVPVPPGPLRGTRPTYAEQS